MKLEILLAVFFGGSLLTYLLGKISKRARDILAVLVLLFATAGITSLYGKSSTATLYTGFLDFPMVLSIHPFAWIFALTIAVVGLCAVIFSWLYIRKKGRTDFFYFMMLLVIFSMIGIVLSGDFLSFYIFWEMMSWSTFLLISYNRGKAIAAGMKYIVMSVAGSLAMLVGMISLYTQTGTLVFEGISGSLNSASSGYLQFILILFFVAFGIKNAIWPLHVWLPPAHSEAPSPFSAVLSGVLIKIGTFGFILLIYGIIQVQVFVNLGHALFNVRNLLLLLGAVTILIPTFIALFQDDAKRLLAWSTVAQAGYIILGIAYGTSESLSGGTLHFFNHALFKSLLFMVVGAVEFRTNGVRDLNSLGGLIKKMPVTFVAGLIGVCGLIGVPLTNGFVSKWLIYHTLIVNHSPFLAFVALLGTWGTILYSYKLIHHIFLGQLPRKYEKLQAAPVSMKVPMIFLSLTVFVFGVLPGLPLHVINLSELGFGMEPLAINMWGVVTGSGSIQMLNIATALILGGIVLWLFFRMGPKNTRADQMDNYAAGAPVPADRYQYSVKFYDPLTRMIAPYLKDIADNFYSALARGIRNAGNGIRRIYTGDVGNYALYIILFLAILIFIQLYWKVW
ncbi:MAG TPA: hypothetical protein ENN63_02845 [Bacteroidetes bacterium]|nr:hypothetical protein [Bacteroidota bacterium]